MDGIKPNNIGNITSKSIHTGVPAAKSKEAGRSQEPKDQVSLQDILPIRKQDISNSGKVSIIIKADDADKLADLKKKVASNPENKITKDLPIINGFAAEVDPANSGIMPDLSMGVNDIKVFLDGKIGIIQPVEQFDNDAHIMMDVAGKAMNIDKAHEAGFTGKGKTVCIIDTGIAQHPDYKDRIIGFKDITTGKEGVENAYDDQGHGTHCAGIAVGDGKESDGKYKGAAPEANLVGVKVLKASGGGSFSDIISGIQWAVEHKDEFGIDVISMSLGGPAWQNYQDDPVVQAVDQAVEKGIVTVVAAGNSGPRDETISTPAHAPSALTIGALDDKGTVDPSDDGVAYFSSRGPTKDGRPKPDVLTPGVRITAPKHTGGYTTMSGTSMATPMAAGMAAIIKQAAPTVSPGELKGVVMGTADSLMTKPDPNKPDEKPQELPHKDQGAGVFDLVETIEKLTGQDISQLPQANG